MINQLYQVICDRRDHPKADSYVSSLLTTGGDKILQKIAEEATEVILAAKNFEAGNGVAKESNPDKEFTSNKPLIHEIADLTFHIMVLMAEQQIPPAAIEKELKRRFGVSGLMEKANRQS